MQDIASRAQWLESAETMIRETEELIKRVKPKERK
jgi:hypothetical protein